MSSTATDEAISFCILEHVHSCQVCILFFSPHLSTSTLCSVPAWIMTCQCFLSSAISVIMWFLAISSFTRSRHLSFGLPRFRFPSTVICNIFILASSLSHLRTCMSKPSQPLLSVVFCHRVHVCLFPDVYICHMI